MTQFNSVADLRAFLETLLADDLGTFSNGLNRIWVTPPQPPAGIGEGLECIIQRTPETEVRGSSGGQKKDFRRWIVTLTNFSDDDSLDSASQKIKASSRLVFYREPEYTPAAARNYESFTFHLIDTVLLMTTLEFHHGFSKRIDSIN